jgi:AbiV family abortive infection protein
MANRPKPWIALEAAFYRAVENGRAYEFIASGIEICLENAVSLAAEFACLVSNDFNARVQFVMATAMEEIGKALILFDFARIPRAKKDWITGLCKAFYSHLKKGAYAKIIYWPGSGVLVGCSRAVQT